MSEFRHCCVLGAPTGRHCHACHAERQEREARLEDELKRFSESAEAAAIVEQERWNKFGGHPYRRGQS